MEGVKKTESTVSRSSSPAKFSALMSVTADERPEYMDQSLQGLAAQTLPADEVVLIKDGNPDPGLSSVVDQYRRKLNIRSIIFNSQNGLARALNRGLEECRNELVARIDSDDICLPRRFEKQTAFFAAYPDIDVLGGYATDIDEAGKEVMLREKPVTHEEIVSSLWTNPIIHPTVMYKKSKVLAEGGYNEFLPRRQDYELWFRLARRGLRFYNIPEPLILYRLDMQVHEKHTISRAWEQALIGYSGTCMMKLAWWKRFACFIPFFRAFLPLRMQRIMYIAERKLYRRLWPKLQ